jgi:hypothetical protein
MKLRTTVENEGVEVVEVETDEQKAVREHLARVSSAKAAIIVAESKWRTAIDEIADARTALSNACVAEADEKQAYFDAIEALAELARERK